MATDPRTYSVYGFLTKETPKAMLIQVETVEGEPLDPVTGHWFPKTQIVDQILAEDPDDMDKFTIKHWILAEKGLVK